MVIKICATFFLEGAKEGLQAKQVLKIGKESYDYMVSDNYPPGEKMRDWKRLSKKERVAKHLSKIKYDLDAKSYEFEIFPD